MRVIELKAQVGVRIGFGFGFYGFWVFGVGGLALESRCVACLRRSEQ